MAGHHSRSLWPQLPKGSTMQKALQPSDTHCHHPLGKTHVLTLPKTLGAAPTFLRVTATAYSPAIRSSLLPPPPHESSPLSKAPATKSCIQVLPIVPTPLEARANHTPANLLSRGNSLHTLRKETSSIQTKISLHAKKRVRPHKLPTDISTYK